MTAPIAMFVYNRPQHTARTVAALAANEDASKTDLFVFCDGPKGESDQEAVAAVRDIFRDATGFRSVSVSAQNANRGLARSIIDGVTEIVAEYGRVIVIEDDITTHPRSLRYFNTLLNHFSGNSGVFSIGGYSFPPDLLKIPETYDYDVYAIPRMQCWGWATWKDRWDKADFSVPDFESFDRSPAQTAAFAYRVGGDCLHTLRSCMAGELDVWACRWVYAHFKNSAVCICPTRSYVDNTGLDGTGTNSGEDQRLRNILTASRPDSLRLPDTAFVDPRIFRGFMRVADPGWPGVAAGG